MAEHGYFEHSSLDGSPFSRRVAAVYAPGARRWSVGEKPRLGIAGVERPESSRPVARESSASGDSALADVARRGLGAVRAVAGGVYGGPRRHDPDCGLRRPALAQPTRRCVVGPASSLRPLLWVLESGGISADTDTDSPRCQGTDGKHSCGTGGATAALGPPSPLRASARGTASAQGSKRRERVTSQNGDRVLRSRPQVSGGLHSLSPALLRRR